MPSRETLEFQTHSTNANFFPIHPRMPPMFEKGMAYKSKYRKPKVKQKGKNT